MAYPLSQSYSETGIKEVRSVLFIENLLVEKAKCCISRDDKTANILKIWLKECTHWSPSGGKDTSNGKLLATAYTFGVCIKQMRKAFALQLGWRLAH